MGQHARFVHAFACVLISLAALLAGCDRPGSARPATVPSTSPAKPTVASLIPSATDILLELGVRDQIAGISNYDPQTPQRQGIPRVVDYLTADWERLSTIRPNVLILQTHSTDPLFKERAENLGISLLPVHVDRLEEIYPMILTLGDAAHARPAADALVKRIRSELDEVQSRVANQPRVRTLIVLDENAQFAVGPRNFMDDLLTIAGGTNVAGDLSKDYPKIDEEKLLQLNPDAVIQLMPDAPPQVLDAAKAFWKRVPGLNAVKNGRVYIHSDPYLLLPGPRVTDVARLIANDLHHLTPASGPTTTSR
jgi:iron complex transport system substrate-binding protein